ncbi:sugar phosphate exchanger 3-like [Branchiostoma floridae x Branchiostoma belcheri]
MAPISRMWRQLTSKYTIYHVFVFLLTFFSYAFFHATRKTFSNIKTTISSEWTPQFCNATEPCLQPEKIWMDRHLFDSSSDAEPFLGWLDSTFLISYAVGLYISGILGDRFDMRKVLSLGMCLSAVVVFVFGCLTEWVHLYSQPFYILLFVLNGLLQSTGWPCVVAIMGNWFGKSTRGFVLGAWSACASVGNIIGALLVSQVLDYGYEYAFLVTSAVLFAGGVVNFFALVPSPKEVGLPEPEDGDNEDDVGDINDDDEDETGITPRTPLVQTDLDSPVTFTQTRPQAISFFQAVCLPGVIPYSLSYACLKLVNYSFFFWLPFYLHSQYGWKETVADEISIYYDVGGIIGGMIGGYLSDRMKKRAPTVVTMLLLALPSLWGYSASPNNKTTNAGLMAVAGFFIGGPANLISSAISADLGRQDLIKGNSEALSTVTGIVDGTGSVGASIGQIVVPLLHKQLHLDWHWVFYFFMLMTLMTAVCILPLLVREVRSMKCFLNYQLRRQAAALVQDTHRTDRLNSVNS